MMCGMRWKTRCCAICLSLTLQGSLWAAIDPHPTFPEGVGIDIHTAALKPGELEMLAATGVRWVRMDLAWEWTEPKKGEYYFKAYDQLMDALQKANIRAILILDYNNKFYDNGESPHSPEGQAAFARWAAAGVSHFSGRGVIWEMWNEPNGPHYWHPKENVHDYISLAQKVGQAIEQAAPGETFVGPATAGFDFAFQQACYQGGLLKYWSAVTVHAYRPTPPENVSGYFQRLRNLIAQYAPPGKQIPIIVSEWGYPFPGGSIDMETQAKYLPRMWLTDLSNGSPLSIWYDWFDPHSASPWDMVSGPYNGSRDPVYQPKPAYEAAKTVTSVLNGYRFEKRLSVGSPQDYVLAFSNGSETRYAVWSASSSPHPVKIPVSGGVFGVTSYTGQQGPALAAGPGGLSIVLTDAPQYLQPGGGSAKLPGAAPAKSAAPASRAKSAAPTAPSANLTRQQAEALNLAWKNLARAYQDVMTMGPDSRGATAKLRNAVGAAIHELRTVDPELTEASALQAQDAGKTRSDVSGAVREHLDLARKYVAESRVRNPSTQRAMGQIMFAYAYLRAADTGRTR